MAPPVCIVACGEDIIFTCKTRYDNDGDEVESDSDDYDLHDA